MLALLGLAILATLPVLATVAARVARLAQASLIRPAVVLDRVRLRPVRRRPALREQLAGHRRPPCARPQRSGRVHLGDHALREHRTGRIRRCSRPCPATSVPGWRSARSSSPPRSPARRSWCDAPGSRRGSPRSRRASASLPASPWPPSSSATASGSPTRVRLQPGPAGWAHRRRHQCDDRRLAGRGAGGGGPGGPDGRPRPAKGARLMAPASRRRFLGYGLAGVAAVAAVGFGGVELIRRGDLPGKGELDALDGACSVPAARPGVLRPARPADLRHVLLAGQEPRRRLHDRLPARPPAGRGSYRW